MNARTVGWVNRPDLSIVVPVYNNRGTLAELVDRLHAALGMRADTYELLFVDDGSRDGSLEYLETLASSDSAVRVFALAANFGSQAALCAGFDLARGAAIVCIDADLENLPEDIPALLDELDRGYDLVCGVRESRPGTPLLRRIGSAVLNFWVRRREKTTVRDIGCGMRAMKSSVVAGLALEGEHRRLLTPLLLRRAESVSDVPIRAARRPDASAHSYVSLLGIAADYALLSAKRPFLISCAASFACAAAGAIALVAAATSGMTAAAVIGATLLVGGGLGCLLSLIGEYVQRIYRLSHGPPFYALREQTDREPHTEPRRARSA